MEEVYLGNFSAGSLLDNVKELVLVLIAVRTAMFHTHTHIIHNIFSRVFFCVSPAVLELAL